MTATTCLTPARRQRRRLLLACCVAAMSLLTILLAPPPPDPRPVNPLYVALCELAPRQHLVASGGNYDIYSDTPLPQPLVQWYQRVIEAALPLAAQRFSGVALPRVEVRFVTDPATRRTFDIERLAAQGMPPRTVVISTYTAVMLPHEFVHLYTAAAWPAVYSSYDWDWLTEGIAVHDTMFSNQGRVLTTCREFAEAPDTGAQWLYVFDGTDRAYRLAMGFTAWLIECHGEGAPAALAAAAADGASMPAALARVTGQDIPALLAAWRDWLASGGLDRHFAARHDWALTVTRALLPYDGIPAGFRDNNMIVHFFSPPPVIEEHFVRWNLRVAPQGGADGFEHWQNSYRAMARGGRGRDILLANRDHPAPLLRAVTRELLAASPAVTLPQPPPVAGR